MRSQKQQTLFWNGLRVTLVLIIAFLLSVLLSNISARSSPTSLMAQVPLPPRKSNPCSALMQKDFAAIPDAPTAILSTQVVPATAQTPNTAMSKGM